MSEFAQVAEYLCVLIHASVWTTKGRENDMTEIASQVTAAAEWLDDLVGRVDGLTPTWREEINASRLDMLTASKCILGQLFEHYDTGVSKLTAVDRPGYTKHAHAFVGFTESWKRAIKAPRVGENIEWERSNESGNLLKAVRNITLNGEHYVAFVGSYGAAIYTVSEFRAYYRPKVQPKFKKGDVLEDQDGKFFMFESENRIVNFKDLTWANMNYWTGTDGRKFTLNTTKTGSALWGSLINRA